MSGKIEFDNADAAKPIVVNAAFKPATSVTVANIGDGLTRITSPFDWAGTLSVMAGTLALSNDTQTAFSSTLTGPGEFRKEGTLVVTKYLEVSNGKRLVLSGSGAPGAGGALVQKTSGFCTPTNVGLAGGTVFHGEAANAYVQFGVSQPTVFDMQGHRPEVPGRMLLIVSRSSRRGRRLTFRRI